MTDLPPGWTNTRLSEICAINPRVDKATLDPASVVSFVPMPAVEAETGNIDVSETRDFETVRKGYTPFREGDILFAKITPCMENGKIAIVPELASAHGFGSTEFHVLRPSNGVDPRFIYYAVSNRAFRFHAKHNMTGAVGQKRVPVSVLEEHEFGLPPQNEQRRIVEKVEAMFDEIAKGVESLRAAKSTLDLYRKSLLKAAFEGRLTADWRARNPDKLESPDDLLARIRQERERRYQAALEDWREAVSHWVASGEMGRKPAKPKRLLPLADMADCPKRAATPPEWIWLWLAGLGTVNGGLTKNQGRNSLPLMAAYLRVANVYTNRLELDEIKQIGVTQDELRRTRLVPGDLLFVEGNGSIDQIGRVALWDGSIPDMTHQNHLIRFSTDGFLLQRFALLFCMSPEGRELITAQASSTSGLHTLSISKVEALPVPICAPDEQAEVVRLLDLELDAADILEAEIGAGLARAEALRQSILKEAFAGRLVPQDPQDEPASDLLARIGTAHRSDHKETRQQAANA